MAVDIDTFAQDFASIVDLCADLEQATVPERVKQRLCKAFSRALEKALCMSWDTIPDEPYIHRSVKRHAERGARDFLA